MTQNVISAIDGATGDVIENAEVVFSAEGQDVLACPTWIGGKDWEAGAYSPRTNRLYMPLRNACARMMATRDGGMDLYALAVRTQFAPGFDQLGTVQAISAETGATEWLYEQRTATMSLVATGGGLVFGGDVNGRFRAFDDETGGGALGDQSRLGGHRLPDHLRGRRPAVRRGEHGDGGDRVGVHSADARDYPERRQQPVRVCAALTPGSELRLFRTVRNGAESCSNLLM